MKKRSTILILLLTLTLFAFFSTGIAAETEKNWIVVFDTEHYSDTEIQGVAEEYGLESLLAQYYAADEETAALLRNHPMILSAEAAGTATLCEVETSASYYNDPYYSGQWALPMVNVEKCWKNYTTGSKEVVVCVIDSGFFVGHEDANTKNSNFIAGKDYVKDLDKLEIDCTSHGTSCAGLIGATSNNGIGISGMLKDVTVVNQRTFYYDKDATTQEKKKAYVGDVVKAIRDAVDIYHADVINMSFLFDSSNQDSDSKDLLELACQYAYGKGAILVAAAGNNAAQGSTLQYPAAFDCVIGVGAVDSNCQVASFSARNNSVYCCAPGEAIRSLRNPYSPEDFPDDGNIYYRLASGTSLATPFVASLAALARSFDENITPAEFAALLKQTGRDLGDPGYDTSYGYGLIDCEKLLKAMSDKADGNIFEDISKGQWYYDSVMKVYHNRLMVGLSETLFGAEEELTRAMFVTILYRMDGKPEVTGNVSFTDVENGSYYQKAVIWGKNAGIVYGVSDQSFAPQQPINRQEVVTMLYRYYNDYKKVPLPVDNRTSVSFEDAASIADWAKTSVDAMVKAGIIKGYQIDTGRYAFRPQTIATRAVAAQIISGLYDLDFTPENPDIPQEPDTPEKPATPQEPNTPKEPNPPEELGGSR